MVGLLSLLRLALWAAGRVTGEGYNIWELRKRFAQAEERWGPFWWVAKSFASLIR